MSAGVLKIDCSRVKVLAAPPPGSKPARVAEPSRWVLGAPLGVRRLDSRPRCVGKAHQVQPIDEQVDRSAAEVDADPSGDLATDGRPDLDCMDDSCGVRDGVLLVGDGQQLARDEHRRGARKNESDRSVLISDPNGDVSSVRLTHVGASFDAQKAVHDHLSSGLATSGEHESPERDDRPAPETTVPEDGR